MLAVTACKGMKTFLFVWQDSLVACWTCAGSSLEIFLIGQERESLRDGQVEERYGKIPDITDSVRLGPNNKSQKQMSVGASCQVCHLLCA